MSLHNQHRSFSIRRRPQQRATTTTTASQAANAYRQSLLLSQKWNSTTAAVGTTTQQQHAATSSLLTERLQELLVFELHRDGSRQYLNTNVRGLYRYVLTAITAAGTAAPDSAGTTTGKAAQHRGSHRRQPSSTALDASSSENVLGAAAAVSTELPAVIDEHPQTQDNDTESDRIRQQSQQDATDNNNNPEAVTHPPPPPPPPTTHSLLAYESGPRNTRATLRRVATAGAIPPPLNLDGSSNNNNNAEAPPCAAQQQQPQQQQPEPITYRERLGGYLHPRDMRRLVTPFSTSNEPELIVRRHAMLLNFDPLRAIILRDRLLVLVPDGADSLLVHLEQRVRGGSDEMENSIFGDNTQHHAGGSGGSGGDGLGATEHSTASGAGAATFLSNKAKHSAASATKKATNVFTKILHRSASREASRDLDEKATAAASEASGSEQGEDGVALTDDDDDAASEMDEWHELEAREWIKLPFELQCVDAVLHVVGSILTDDTMELQTAAQSYMDQLLSDSHHQHGLTDDPLTIIRVVKDAVQLMTARVKGFTQSLNRILDEDEDMSLMNLSRLISHPERFIQPVPQQVLDEESDEPELILEANLQIALTLQNYLDLVQGQINTAKELVDQKQDATRNRLLLANMLISVFTLCVTMASLVGSLLGMNVPNGLDESANAFGIVCWTSVLGACGMCLFIMLVLFRTGTIPRTPIRGGKGVEL